MISVFINCQCYLYNPKGGCAAHDLSMVSPQVRAKSQTARTTRRSPCRSPDRWVSRIGGKCSGTLRALLEYERRRLDPTGPHKGRLADNYTVVHNR